MRLGVRRIGSADVIDIVRSGKTVDHFKAQVHLSIEAVFDAHPDGKADCHGTIRLPLGIESRPLPFRTQGAQVYLLPFIIRIRIIIESSYTKGDIRGEPGIITSGNELKEIEIALDSQFPDIGIEAEVPPQHKFIAGIVLICISQKRLITVTPYTHIITNLLTHDTP